MLKWIEMILKIYLEKISEGFEVYSLWLDQVSMHIKDTLIDEIAKYDTILIKDELRKKYISFCDKKKMKIK
jgi:hypothetical protein